MHRSGTCFLSPLVMSATGVLAEEADTFYKWLASLLSTKWDHPYSSTLCWLCCRLSFSLLRSAIMSIRGPRSSCGQAIRIPSPVDLINTDSNIRPPTDFKHLCYNLIFYLPFLQFKKSKEGLRFLETYGNIPASVLPEKNSEKSVRVQTVP